MQTPRREDQASLASNPEPPSCEATVLATFKVSFIVFTVHKYSDKRIRKIILSIRNFQFEKPRWRINKDKKAGCLRSTLL